MIIIQVSRYDFKR